MACSKLLLLLASCVCTVLSATAPLYRSNSEDKIPNSYIVVLKDAYNVADLDDVITRLEQRSKLFKLNVRFPIKYTKVYRGFSVEIPEHFLPMIRSLEEVAYVQEDAIMKALQDPVAWNLDRIDQRDLPLDNVYNPAGDGTGSNVYIVDTGVRYTHEEFNGRASFFYDYESGGDGSDCHGHGTHGAGVVGGLVYGVAKNANLYSVRVLNCFGVGSTSQIVAGLDYIAANGQSPGVASLAIGGGPSTALDDGVRRLVAAGFQASISAGGSNADACNFSPARVEEAITVGSTDSQDNVSPSTNKGPCVDVFAPGQSITSAWHTNDFAYATISGTSSSAAHSAGVCAIILQGNPAFTAEEVKNQLTGDATADRLNNVPADTANLLLYTSA
ncbi:aqualysin-1-like [Glandiceps talaboti]